MFLKFLILILVIVSFMIMSPGGHAGKFVPATEHITRLLVSSVSVHFSMIPSVQVLLCSCIPGPQSGFSPVPWQEPSFSHGPNVFGTVKKILNDYILSISNKEIFY